MGNSTGCQSHVPATGCSSQGWDPSPVPQTMPILFLSFTQGSSAFPCFVHSSPLEVPQQSLGDSFLPEHLSWDFHRHPEVEASQIPTTLLCQGLPCSTSASLKTPSLKEFLSQSSSVMSVLEWSSAIPEGNNQCCVSQGLIFLFFSGLLWMDRVQPCTPSSVQDEESKPKFPLFQLEKKKKVRLPAKSFLLTNSIPNHF